MRFVWEIPENWYWYHSKGMEGTLRLPRYEWDPETNAPILYLGETFCRVDGCTLRFPYLPTSFGHLMANYECIRWHLKYTHNAGLPNFKDPQSHANASTAWFRELEAMGPFGWRKYRPEHYPQRPQVNMDVRFGYPFKPVNSGLATAFDEPTRARSPEIDLGPWGRAAIPKFWNPYYHGAVQRPYASMYPPPVTPETPAQPSMSWGARYGSSLQQPSAPQIDSWKKYLAYYHWAVQRPYATMYPPPSAPRIDPWESYLPPLSGSEVGKEDTRDAELVARVQEWLAGIEPDDTIDNRPNASQTPSWLTDFTRDDAIDNKPNASRTPNWLEDIKRYDPIDNEPKASRYRDTFASLRHDVNDREDFVLVDEPQESSQDRVILTPDTEELEYEDAMGFSMFQDEAMSSDA